MTFYDRITGRDITRAMEEMEARVRTLPAEYRTAWAAIVRHLQPYSNITGRNMVPILQNALEFLEIAVADGQPLSDVLDENLQDFCAALAAAQGAENKEDRWRRQLNQNVMRKLGEQACN